MDDRKSSTKSKGGWIIADEEGRENLSGFNPDFGEINKKTTELKYKEHYEYLCYSMNIVFSTEWDSNHQFNINATTMKFS